MNGIKNPYYFGTRKGCGKFPFGCRRRVRRIIPFRIPCSPSFILPFFSLYSIFSASLSYVYHLGLVEFDSSLIESKTIDTFYDI